ncbi:hypothetical protein SAVIM40S_04180 [Streptomyces avidinii]
MADALLFNPHTYDPAHFDPETRRLLRATVDWFESRGKRRLIEDYRSRAWLADFLAFSAKEGLFATFLTPATAAGEGESDKRWDTARIAALNEIFGFYGLDYWYAWQVTILGLGPVWQSDNAEARERARSSSPRARCSPSACPRTHGADIYSTDMLLQPYVDEDGAGGFRATGSKYYIGNGNAAGLVSVFGRRTDIEGPDGYVFFAADSRHAAYHLVKNVVDSSKYVSEFRLDDYPVRAEDVLHTGRAAFDAALNTVNVGKFNLCTASIGICDARDVRGRHPRAQPRPLRPPRHRLPARPPGAGRRAAGAGPPAVRPARWDVRRCRPRRHRPAARWRRRWRGPPRPATGRSPSSGRSAPGPPGPCAP